MPYTPRVSAKELIDRLTQAAHDPRQSMVYNDFATEFHAGYLPSSFDQKRLMNNIAMRLWREYPDTPRFVGTFRRPGTGRNFLTLYFSGLAEKQHVGHAIDDAIRQECTQTGEAPDRLGHQIYTGRHHRYQMLVHQRQAQAPRILDV